MSDHDKWQVVGRVVFGAIAITFAIIAWLDRRKR